MERVPQAKARSVKVLLVGVHLACLDTEYLTGAGKLDGWDDGRKLIVSLSFMLGINEDVNQLEQLKT